MPALASLARRDEPTTQTDDPQPIAAVIAAVLANYGLEGAIPARNPHIPIRTSPVRGREKNARRRTTAATDYPSADSPLMRLADVP